MNQFAVLYGDRFRQAARSMAATLFHAKAGASNNQQVLAKLLVLGMQVDRCVGKF